MRILKDILTETKQGRTKYSQGRIYLFVSFFFFFLLNVVLGIGAITNAVFEDQETLLVVSENLRWALGSFALYVLGGKGIGAFTDSKTGISNDYMHEAQYPGGVFYPPYGGYGPGGGGGNPGGGGPSGGGSNNDDFGSQNPLDPTDDGEDYYTQGNEEVV